MSGYVEASKLGCLGASTGLHGSVRLSGVVILNAQSVHRTMVTHSMGFFSKKRITLFEAEKQIQLTDGTRSSFSFSLSSIAAENNVFPRSSSECRLLFPILTLGLESPCTILFRQVAGPFCTPLV